jgi:FlaA1/EpsC-like NDP-sugar epimerase
MPIIITTMEATQNRSVKLYLEWCEMLRKMASIALIPIDCLIVTLASFLALFIRLEGTMVSSYYAVMWQYLPVIVIVRLTSFYLFGLYNRLWRYASISELLSIIGAVTVSTLFITVVVYLSGAPMPRSIHVISWLLNILLIGASRMLLRILYLLRQSNLKENSRKTKTNVLIIGAGDAGAIIAREMLHSRYCTDKYLVGFIDDSLEKKDQRIFGVKVLGTSKEIYSIVNKYNIQEIIIAMPSVAGSTIKEIIQECKSTGCKVKTLPGLYEMIDGKVTVQQLRNVDITDLLRREPVKLDLDEIAGYLSGKRVLVTGAGGSIGSELCRQIAKMSPASLALVGKGENSIYEIDCELRSTYADLATKPIIADVRDADRINTIFAECRPQVVFHAAAHKHVPLMEEQPVEAVKNNIFGTKVVAEAADRVDAGLFVMISTDKAVNPTSVMGATKRVAELIIQHMNRISSTKFMAVRFGNVLGSRGSVVPLFKKQIAQGGPITITHPKMQRYFMTIPEAVQLVLQAGAIANGGEVFVLDMGKPVKIMDMACDLIELSGLKPHTDIKIEFTGLRPGEKLFEELLTAEEGTRASRYEKIFVANLREFEEKILQRGLFTLQNMENKAKIIEALGELVPAYKIAREKYGNALAEDGKGGQNEAQRECASGLDDKYPSVIGFSR